MVTVFILTLFPLTLRVLCVLRGFILLTAKPAEIAKDSATAFIPTLFLNPLCALCVLCGFIVKLTAECAEYAKAKKEGVAEKQTASVNQQPLRLREPKTQP